MLYNVGTGHRQLILLLVLLPWWKLPLPPSAFLLLPFNDFINAFFHLCTPYVLCFLSFVDASWENWLSPKNNHVQPVKITYFIYLIGIFLKDRGSHSQMFFKIGVLKMFAIFTGKHLRWSFFSGFPACNFVSKKTPRQVFSCLRTYFFYRTPPVAASKINHWKCWFLLIFIYLRPFDCSKSEKRLIWNLNNNRCPYPYPLWLF